MRTKTALEKEARLKTLLESFGAVAVAYSGGVDSTYLADVARETLDDKAHLLIADSASIPRDELREALDLARARNWHIEVIETGEFANPAFLKNDPQRCYHCKKELFDVVRRYAEKHHIPVIAHGETAEDSQDATRVGIVAARESNARAPLAEAGFTKADIRERSRARGLPTWDKASFACLASRLPTGAPIDRDTLNRIEQAEAVLRTLGCHQYRARHHGDICRIEVAPADFPLFLQEDKRSSIVTSLRALGYRYITLDLTGYRTGSTAG